MKKHRGSTLIELIMVMMLIALFGITISSLIVSGANAQENLIKRQEEQTDARTTLAFINVLLKQHDGGELSIKEMDNENQSIFIRAKEGEDFHIWYYYKDGGFYEFFGKTGEYPSLERSLLLFEVEDGLTISFNQESRQIEITLEYLYGEEIKKLESLYTIRSQETNGL